MASSVDECADERFSQEPNEIAEEAARLTSVLHVCFITHQSWQRYLNDIQILPYCCCQCPQVVLT